MIKYDCNEKKLCCVVVLEESRNCLDDDRQERIKRIGVIIRKVYHKSPLWNGAAPVSWSQSSGLTGQPQPSLSPGFSAAWPSGNIVLTKIPMEPLGESIPPTTLKPSPFLTPGPFSNSTLWTVTPENWWRRGILLFLMGSGFFMALLWSWGRLYTLALCSVLWRLWTLSDLSRHLSTDLDTRPCCSALLGRLWTDWLRPPRSSVSWLSPSSPIMMTVLVMSPVDMMVLSVTTFL